MPSGRTASSWTGPALNLDPTGLLVAPGTAPEGRLRGLHQDSLTQPPGEVTAPSSWMTQGPSPLLQTSRAHVGAGARPGAHGSGQLLPPAQGPGGPGLTSALVQRTAFPWHSRGGPAFPFNSLASLLNGKCLISIWALTKWNFPSVMEVTSALSQARQGAGARIPTAGHSAGRLPPERASSAAP